jgi:hypothetical protein
MNWSIKDQDSKWERSEGFWGQDQHTPRPMSSRRHKRIVGEYEEEGERGDVRKERREDE